jgi:TP901 family phage tail tape measure protein
MDFEAQIRRVAAVTTDTIGGLKGGLQTMTDAAIKEASKFSFSNEEAAQALYILASAGLSAKESVDALHGTMSLAQATGASLKESTYLQTAAINTFGIAASNASNVADLLTTAVNASALEVGDLSYSFKYAAGPAQSAGVGITDLTTALMVMAQGGIRGQRAGTSLRMSFKQLIDPTAKAKGAMADLGLTTASFVGPNGGLRKLNEILPMIREKLLKLPKAQQSATVAALVGTNAWSGFQTLLNQSPKFWDKFEKKARKSFGSVASEADIAAKKTQQSTKAALENTGNMIQGFFIKILMKYSPQIQAALLNIGHWFESLGDRIPDIINFVRPFWDTFVQGWHLFITLAKDALVIVAVGLIILRKIMKPLGKMIHFVNEHWDTFRTILIGIGAILAVFYAIRLAKTIIFWTRFAIATVKVTIAIYKAGGAIRALSFLFMTNPLTIWIVAIGVLIIGLILLWKKFKWFRDAVGAVLDWIKSHWEIFAIALFGPIGIAVVLIVKKWDTLKAAFQRVWDSIKAVFWAAFNWIKKNVIDPIIGFVDTITSWLPGQMSSAEAIAGLARATAGGRGPGGTVVIGGRTVTVSPPSEAAGGITKRAGLSWVGEEGPELLTLPRGARVDPLPAGGPSPLDLGEYGLGEGTIVTKVYLDKKQIAEAVHSYVKSKQARR